MSSLADASVWERMDLFMRKFKEYLSTLSDRITAPGKTVRVVPPKVKKEGDENSDTIVFKTAGKTKTQIKETFLTVTKGPDTGREFLLIPALMKIGRHIENYINLTDARISREHALLEYNIPSKEFILKDLGSTNGTFLNQRRLNKEEKVIPGDEIRVGDTVLKMSTLVN